ncbi:unnamed protein product [Cylicostephanus goldi]|uniref:Uncharacterized protein n=1 Tax=Cylicostephanus goldi TaxID=71465 RepID=A0A3P7MVK0_CYLGO|nr:unnamed protein product [Cylicostephanus goldi]
MARKSTRIAKKSNSAGVTKKANSASVSKKANSASVSKAKSASVSKKGNHANVKQVNKNETAPTTGRRGRKRKVVEEAEATPSTAAKTPRRGRVAHAKVKLSYTDFVTLEVGQRVLSCGEGEQLGHPGRTTTKKPRKVDIVEDEDLQIVQVRFIAISMFF